MRLVSFGTAKPFRILLVVAVFAVAGCKDQAQEANLCTVRGRVNMSGKPAEKVSVMLHPVGFTIPDSMGATPGAKTDSIGAFYLIPGVPAGKYKVSITKSKKAKSTASASGNTPDRYADPATSGLEVDIVPGANELPTFELK